MEQRAPKRDWVSVLARVLGGGFALVMLGSALWHTVPYISSAGQAAATWLGDQTGAPQGALGRPTPDDPLCWIFSRDSWSSLPYCAGVASYVDRSVAKPLYIDIPVGTRNWENSSTVYGFYSATLSVSAADEDPTGKFETDTYWGKGHRLIELSGRAMYDRNLIGSYPPDGIRCGGDPRKMAYPRPTDGSYYPP